MYAHVSIEVAGLGEAQHANTALIWLLTAVYSHMLRQGRWIAERLLAHATPENGTNSSADSEFKYSFLKKLCARKKNALMKNYVNEILLTPLQLANVHKIETIFNIDRKGHFSSHAHIVARSGECLWLLTCMAGLPSVSSCGWWPRMTGWSGGHRSDSRTASHQSESEHAPSSSPPAEQRGGHNGEHFL